MKTVNLNNDRKKIVFLLTFFCLMRVTSCYSMENNKENEVEKLSLLYEKHSVSNPVYLHRLIDRDINNRKYVHYTRQISFKDQGAMLDLKLKLDRGSTKNKIKYVSEASRSDEGKTHLLAQGVCTSAVARWESPLTTALISKAVGKEIDWVSRAQICN